MISDRDIVQTEADPKKGRWIPFVFFGMFAVIIIANGSLIFYAFDSWRGLTTSQAYEKGLAYNQALEASREREALGWSLSLGFRKGGEQQEGSGPSGKILLQLKDAGGQPVSASSVKAGVSRPLQVGLEFNLVFTDQGDGVFVAPVSFPLQGVWDLKVTAETQSGPYEKTERLTIR